MWHHSCLGACLALSLASSSQVPHQPPDAKPDYSKEALVIEKDVSKITFENDGTSTRESTSRIRIQSDAGVQQTVC
jgi:hypothetical protein